MHRTRSSSSIKLVLTLGLPSYLILPAMSAMSAMSVMPACGGSSPGSETAIAESISASTTDEMQETTAEESSTVGIPETDATETIGGTETNADTETTADAETTTEDEDDGDAINFDLGTVPDSPPYDESCGMVDFLFVIDNSGSMSDEQISLINNFPTFITGIETTLDSVDSIHVGVTTTDDYAYNMIGCNGIGSLVVQTGGGDSSMAMCGPYEEGDNFMTEDEDDLGAAFACAAQVGTDGSADERQMQAVLSAVDGTHGGVDQCNEDFIREDALLVIVIITDEPDANTPGDSMSWFQTVVDAKDGIPENVVVVSLINTPMGNCGFEAALTIADFTTKFGINGFMADICLPDYGPVFDQAVAIIDVACDNFLQQ
jgi:hypothetical protein